MLADLAVPIGKYNNTQPLNLGQNRWYGRLGAPIVWQLGPWVPGRRTTLEFLPAVWLFGANDDYVGQDARDRSDVPARCAPDARLHRALLGSRSTPPGTPAAQATVDGVAGEKLNNFGFGFTLGYTINDNLGLTVGYKSTVNDLDPGDLRMDNFTVSLVYGWHSIIEGAKRLKGGE